MFQSIAFKVILLAAVFLMPFEAHAQAVLTTHDTNISADVSHDGYGLISIYRTATTPTGYLSNPGRSFLTVLLNGQIYTNNTNLPDSSLAVIRYPTTILSNGFDTVIRDTSGKDTVRTTWKNWWGVDSLFDSVHVFDIIQDVYPMTFRNGSHIVIKVRIVNHSNAQITAQAQYLLDVAIEGYDQNGTDYLNDNPTIATEAGYTKVCQTFLNSLPQYVPPFFLAFQFDLGDLGATQFPGNLSCAFLDDTFPQKPIGLIQPLTFTIADWPTIAKTYSWGWPQSMIGTTFSDEAMLYQWPAVTLPPKSAGDSVAELSRTSYGVGGYTECYGFSTGVAAFTFYPYQKHDFFIFSQHGYFFPVTTLIFNNTTTDTLKNTQGILSVDTFFGIHGQFGNQLTQSQVVSPSPMPPRSMSRAFWFDTVNTVGYTDTCWMQLQITADQLNIHGVKVAVPKLNNCNLDIYPSRTGDIYPPSTTIVSREGSFDGSDCNAKCTDMLTIDSGLTGTGLYSIVSSSIVNMQQVVPKPLNSSSYSALFSECVLDSMQDGSATVSITDVVGNIDSLHIIYCTLPDTLPPEIFRDPGESEHINLSIQEDRPWDRGIDTILTDSSQNLNVAFYPTNNWKGLSKVGVIANPIDTTKVAQLCLDVKDNAGHVTSSCFSVAAKIPQGGVAVEESQPLTLTVLPNPSEDIFQIALNASLPAKAEVFDLLGRSVVRFSFTDTYNFDASNFPAGAYILRVSTAGETMSKRIIKE